MFAPGTGRSTPGIVRVKLTKLRPFSGRASICSFATVVPSSELLVWMSGVSAWMVTDSAICPTSSLRSTLTFWSTPTWTLARLTFLKPLSSAVTLYVPVGISGAVYSPLESESTLRVKPLSVFTRFTVAPGSAPPLESRTVPRIVPVTACAASGCGSSAATKAKPIATIQAAVADDLPVPIFIRVLRSSAAEWGSRAPVVAGEGDGVV